MTTHEGDPPFFGRRDMGERGRIQRSKNFVIPFKDHTGNDALMLFENRETCPLPPLYSFAMYFTHKDVNAENVHATELWKALKPGTPLESYPCEFRLELYFLPAPDAEAASVKACMAHYRDEKRKRGEFSRQMEAFEASDSSSTGDDSGVEGLPGFVPSYIKNSYCDWYHALLYMYSGADWLKEEQPARAVRFDPIPQEQYAAIAEEGEPEVLEPDYSEPIAMQSSDPEGDGERFLGLHMYDQAHGETDELSGTWHEAGWRGWFTW